VQHGKLFAFWSRFLPIQKLLEFSGMQKTSGLLTGKKLAAVRFSVLALLTISLVGGASAERLRVYDGFEDGDITSDPQWEGATNNFVTQQTVVKNGNYAVNITSGSKTNIHFDRASNGDISDGDIYQAWVRTSVNDYSIQYGLTNGNLSDTNLYSTNDAVLLGFSDTAYRIRTEDSSGSNIYSTDSFCSNHRSTGTWYRFEIELYPSSSEADFRIYDSSGSLLCEKTGVSTSGASSLRYVGMNTYGYGYYDDVSYSTESENDAPQFNSTSIDPDPPLIGENVSYSAEVYDGDGSIDYTNLTLEYGGSQVLSDAQRVGSTTPEWNDIYKPSSLNKWLNATLETVDDKGAVTSTEINRYLSDEAPNVNLNSPTNSTIYSYDETVSFDVSDSDSKPGEDWNCDIDLDGSLVEEVYLKEGTNSSYSTTVSADKGQHTLDVSCTDGSGNTGSDSVDYTVKRFEIQSVSSKSPVFETENVTYSATVKVGSMVDELATKLYWNGTHRETVDPSNSGVNTYTQDHYFHPPLVQNNDTVENWRIEAEVNYTDINGNTGNIDSRNSSSQSQSVYYAYYNPGISITENRVIEKEDINSIFGIASELSNGKASLTRTQEFNGTSKTGESVKFDTPLAGTNKVSKTVTGDLNVSFRGRERVMNANTDSVDVYKKILTDCTNSVDGVTGSKALEMNLYNEENRSQKLTGNIAFNFDTTHHGEHSRNYAFQKTGVKTTDLCLYPDWAEYQLTGPIQYESESSQNSLGKTFKDRQYNLVNETVDNSTDPLDFYLLSDTYATPVYFEVTDQGGDGVPGAKVKIQRYFIGENSYLTVAKSEADSKGVATTYLRVNEIYYKYTVTKDGEVLLSTDREILTCQTSPCTKELRVNPEEDNPYFQGSQGFQYSTDKLYNNDGNLTGFQATVSHETDLMQKSQLLVERQQTLGTETVCNVTATSNPTTLVCQFSKPAGDDEISYTLNAWANDNKYLLDDGVINQAPNIFSNNAYFAGTVIFLAFSMLGLASPKLGIAFSTAGVIVPWYLGFYAISTAAIGALALTAIGLMVIGNS